MFLDHQVYAATLAAMLIHEGSLDERQRVPDYLPELRGTGYEDATLRDLMDMQVGLAYSELYADSKADIWAYSRAGGFRWRPPGYVGPHNFYEYFETLRKEGEHGQAFAYKTPNTEVLCWMMKRVTGMGLAEMLSERFWGPLGCEQDGYLGVDPIGVPMGGGGLSATLRDLARFGEMMRCDGAWHGHQLVPEAVVADIRRGSDPAKFASAGYVLLPGYSYRSMWWSRTTSSARSRRAASTASGCSIAPKAEMVVARFASPDCSPSAANDPITLPAFLALARDAQCRLTPRGISLEASTALAPTSTTAAIAPSPRRRYRAGRARHCRTHFDVALLRSARPDLNAIAARLSNGSSAGGGGRREGCRISVASGRCSRRFAAAST